MLIKFHDLIEKHNINVKGILHVGAHIGEESEDYLSAGVDRVVWVEANPNVFLKLLQNVAHIPGNSFYWFAAHEKTGQVVELNIASNGESSSILEFDHHAIEHPHISWVGKVAVPTRRLDELLISSGYDLNCFNFVNLDIQGAELLALKGLTGVLDKIDYIYTEVNEKHLYKDCCLIGEIDSFLNEFGFSRTATEMTTHGWGDALYVRDR